MLSNILKLSIKNNYQLNEDNCEKFILNLNKMYNVGISLGILPNNIQKYVMKKDWKNDEKFMPIILHNLEWLLDDEKYLDDLKEILNNKKWIKHILESSYFKRIIASRALAKFKNSSESIKYNEECFLFFLKNFNFWESTGRYKIPEENYEKIFNNEKYIKCALENPRFLKYVNRHSSYFPTEMFQERYMKYAIEKGQLDAIECFHLHFMMFDMYSIFTHC